MVKLAISPSNCLQKAKKNTPTLMKSLFYLTLIQEFDTLAITLGNYKELRSLSKQPNYNRIED